MSGKTTSRFVLMICALFLGTFVLSATRSAGAAPDAFSLTVNVNPAGKGTVNVSAPPPYSDGQVVTLTAVPIAGWQFDRWELSSDLVWWNNGWDYRVAVTAGAAGHARKDKPAEIDLNFTAIWASLGKTGTLDPNSIRVVEVDASDAVVDDNVPFQFDKAVDFNASSKAAGTLVLLMEGNTGAGAQRRYHVYFDVTGKGFTAPSFPAQVTLTQGVSDESSSAYKIQTASGVYFYHTKGGGLSSLNDVDGNDWITYRSSVAGNGGRFRGIPNAVSPNNGGHFHPGATTMTSTLLNEGPLKATVHVIERKAPAGREKWEGMFEFYPDYIVFTMLTAPYNYWFLYEGTPGGQLQPAIDFIVRNDGTQTLTSQAWEGDLVGEEWVYVSDPGLGRSIYFANHLDDDKTDSYDDQDGIMTKFGFGRKGAGYQLDPALVPREFTFGLMDETVYEDAKPIIYNAYKDLNVTQGAAEARAGASLGTTNPVDFTITGEHTITAYFKPQQFTVNVTVSPAGMGTVTRTPNKAAYDFNEQVTLQATPEPGWVFAGWSGDLTGATNPATVTVTQNLNITATFAQSFTVTTSANPPGSGTVTLNPPGPSFPPNTQVQVTATPADGYSFTNWSGDLSGTNPTQTITVNANMAIVANFSQGQYTFSAVSSGNGSVAWEPVKPLYAAGEVVTVTATADSGFSFAGWTGDLISSLNPLTVTINGDTEITAHFVPQVNYTLTLNALGGGTIEADPALAQYPAGTLVRLTAIPDAQKRFAGWSGAINGTANPIDVQVNSNMVVTATFVDDVYPLQTNVVGMGSITKQPDQPNGYYIGQVVTLTAVAAPGWQFDSWSGDAAGTNATTSVTIVGPTNVTANFSALGPFSLTVSTTGNGSGTVEIDPEKAEYNYGDIVTLTPVPGPDSVFAGWSGDAGGSASPLQLTIDGDKNVIANFIIPTGPFSDNFNACSLPARWASEQVGDATIVATGRTIRIQIPEGSDHYINKSFNNAPRIMQSADNRNFELVAKFDSELSQNYQTQGILIEQDTSTLLRVDFTYNNDQMTVFAGVWTPGKLQQRLSFPIAAADANYLRVTRAADKWTISYSATGAEGSWQLAGDFKYTMNVSRAGVFAGNLKPAGGVAPALTAEIDFFQNVAEGPMPEDASLLTVNTVGNGTVIATPPANQLSCGQTVVLRAAPSVGWTFGGWTGDAIGTQLTVSMLINRPRTVTATFNQADIFLVVVPMILR